MDIIKNLRDVASDDQNATEMTRNLCYQAAAEIERLRSCNSALKGAFDRLMNSLPPDFPDRAYYDEITALH